MMRRLEHLESIPQLSQSPGADRPTKMSAWVQTVRTILSPSGSGVQRWWTWAVSIAQQTHSLYLSTPKMERPGVRVTTRCPTRLQDADAFLRPSLIKLLTQECKQMALRWVQPALEAQDYICQAVVEYHPGDTQDRSAILSQIRTPGAATAATGALTILRR